MATIEPVKVIEPTKSEITIEISSTIRDSPSAPMTGKSATPSATSREDIPPQPLNRATISGIEVIGTL